MADRKIATMTALLQSHCAYAQALRLLNADNSRFDYSSGQLVGEVRLQAPYTETPLVAFTITRSNPAQGECTIALSAANVGLLPATGVKFELAQKLVGEINFVPDADPQNPIRLVEIDVRVSPGGVLNPDAAPAPTIPLETVNLIVGAASPATTRALLGLSPANVAFHALLS